MKRLLARFLPTACVSLAGLLILAAMDWAAWPLWPVALYGLGLTIGWWPLRPKGNADLRWSLLVVLSIAQAVVYVVAALPLAAPSTASRLPAWEDGPLATVCFAAALVGCPAVGLLAIVAARRGAVLAVTQLFVPFLALLWYLALSLADAPGSSG